LFYYSLIRLFKCTSFGVADERRLRIHRELGTYKVNCEKDDIAFIRSTHPLCYLHGVTVTVNQFMGDLDGEVDVWRFTFSGTAQPDDTGTPQIWGFIADRYLVPIAGPRREQQDNFQIDQPEALRLALGIQSRSYV
jgi:hypothetical protein